MPRKRYAIDGMDIMVSTACNLNCPGCYGHMDILPNKNMDMETAMKFTEFAFRNRQKPPEKHVFSFVFFGGEPLVNWPLIEEYLPWLKETYPVEEYNYDLYLFTNGILLDEARMDFLVSNGVEIIVSIDGEYEDQIIRRPMPRDMYNRIIANVRYMVEKGYTERLKVYTLVPKAKMGEVPRIIDFFRNMGVRRMEFSKIGEEPWDFSERQRLLDIVASYKKRHGEMSFTFNPESAMDCITCRPKFLLAYPNGDMYDLCILCSLLIKRMGRLSTEALDTMYIGNVNDTEAVMYDVDSKRALIQGSGAFCPTIQRDGGGRLRMLRE